MKKMNILDKIKCHVQPVKMRFSLHFKPRHLWNHFLNSLLIISPSDIIKRYVLKNSGGKRGDFLSREKWTTKCIKYVKEFMMLNKCSQQVDRILVSNGHWGNKIIYMAQKEAKKIWYINYCQSEWRGKCWNKFECWSQTNLESNSNSSSN